MDAIKEFIKPELLSLIPVLYIIGAGLKKSGIIKSKYIPLTIGAAGILLSCLYTIGASGLSAAAIFTAITQGILCAGATVYVNQIYKQGTKEE